MPDIKLPKGFKLDEEVKPPKGFTLDEKKNETLQSVAPTGTQTSKRGFEPFLPQVPTKTPSVLLSDEQKQQREKQRIGERFETTLLNVPTEFGKVDQFMRSAKKVKDTLPQIPTIKPSTGGMVVIPQGEKIGDSLRKGDTLQDELTDKLTGKKTALQKQIESAQEAFRTVQGEDVYGEIQDAQQLDNMSPERVEAERERKGNYVKFLYNQFLDGTGSAVSGLVDVALAIDKGMPLASPLSKSGLILDYYRKNNAKGVRNFLRDNIGAEVDKGLEAKYNEGMLTGAIGGLASSAPAMLTGGMTKGLSMVAQMYDGAIQSIESRPDADQWDNDTKTLFAGTLGLIQGQLEKYGLDKVLKGGELTNVIFKKILKSAEGKKITGNILENLIDENVKGVARVFAKGGVRAVDGFASEFYTGAGQEASAIGIESLFDKVTGKPIFDTSNKTNWIGFVDRIAKAGFQEGIGGFALGGGVGMLSGISKKKVKEAQTVINEIDRQLENPDTLSEVAEVLIQRKADTQANIDDIVDEEADNQSKMSSEDFVKSQELSKQIEKIDLALQDPNTGESVKADLESQKKAIESEIDEIIKKKPPIEPPATGGAGVEARIQEIESLLSSDNASMQETGSGNLIKEGREELVLELAELKKKSPVAGVVKPQGKQDAKKADYTKRIEKKIANASEEKNPIKKALILYEALDSATRVDTGQKENVQELLNAHLAESGLKIENVEIGTKYNETNTSLDATIAGDGIENLKVIEVLSPIIRDANGVIVKQGKVIVESSDNKKTPQVAKPTFDTEEQLIEEGKTAEEEYKKTGDQVTYEQKIKELEEREKNLVKTPTEITEAPQRERGSHKIVKSEDNTTLDDMTKGGELVPDDFYDKPKFYTDINNKSSKESLSVIRKAKGNPDAEVTIYRSVPQGVENIEEGDWVSLSPTYAKEHGMHPTDETQDMPVISIKVKAKDIVWDGNDVNEFAYFPVTDKTQENAVSQSISSKVPVLTKAPVGEEVEQGKPQPKTKVVTEEGKEEIKSDSDIEKRMSEIEGDSKFKEEFNSLETEMEKRERESVFNVSLSEVGDSVDALIKKDKDKPNGFGSFIEKRDASETKEVADRYLEASKLTDKELMQDFSDAVRGNPTTWYADGLKLRESIKEASKRGIDTKEMIDEVIKVYTESGYDIETAKSVVSNMLSPILKGAKSVNEKQLKQTPAQQVEQLRAEEQAELNAAIPNADQYLTNGKVDENKLTDPKDINKYDEIYDKYDKLITPLLPKKEVSSERDVTINKEVKLKDGTEVKLKYMLTNEPDNTVAYILGFDKNNNQISTVMIEKGKDGRWKGNDLSVDKKYRRKGLATAMYDFADAEGHNLTPTKSLRPDGIKFWENRKQKAVEQSLKETPKAEPTPAKPKAEPRLKPRVETRLKFTKAIELFNDISAADGAAKKGTLARKRQKFLAQNPSIKYIDDNWRKISDQLKAKGLIETKGNCP